MYLAMPSRLSLLYLLGISFNVVHGWGGQTLIGTTAKRRLRSSKIIRNESALASTRHNVSLKPACSFSGESWDPLHDCFPAFGSHGVDLATRNEMLCRLKRELAFKVEASWNRIVLLENSSKSGSKTKSSNVAAKIECGGSGANCNHSETSSKRFHTCAVISNSGVLRNHQHGSAIDATNMVMRFNDAPLVGWQHLVGTRDDVRIVNNQFPERVLKNVMETYQFKAETVFGLVYDHDASGMHAAPGLDTLRAQHPSTIFRQIDLTLLSSFSETLRSIYDAHWFDGKAVSFDPTTGAIGMLIALNECDQVLAYGMAASRAANYAPYHYYKENELPKQLNADENSWHKTFSAEKDLWRRIAQNSEYDIDQTEIAVIPGFSQVQCT